MIRIRALLLALAGVLGLAGCSSAAPDTSQMVLHYSGGSFSSQEFIECIPPGQLFYGTAFESLGDNYFYYPAGQRTFTFKSDPANPALPAGGADAPSIRVGTKDQQELTVSGSMTFTLNPDCQPYTDATGRVWKGGPLQMFHDTIGRQKGAYAEEDGVAQPGGWMDSLRLYVGGPGERAMDQAGLGYNALELYSNAERRNQWTAEVEKLIRGYDGSDGKPVPGLIEQQAGGPFFLIGNIQLDSPQVSERLRTELEGKQAADLRAQTAATDLGNSANYPGGLPQYLEDERKKAITKAIAEGKINPLIIPEGAPPVMVSPR
jgi:hypothetical protein